MSRRRKDPLRVLTEDERRELTQVSHSHTTPATRVARAVSHLVARFNREGLAALDQRHGGGHEPTYDAAHEWILREVARNPTPETDGTSTWSLTILRRVLRTAPDVLPKVSTFTIWQVLHNAGYTFQRTRTWCPTGSATRRHKAGVVTVTDPDADAKKS